jgi:cyanophycinase
MTFLRTVACVLLTFSCMMCVSDRSTAAAPGGKGHLVIIGGGDRTDEIMDRFITLAGGREKGRIVVLPMASGTPDTTGMEQTAELLGRGARNVSWVMFTREQAMQPGFADTLNGVSGVFFSGGDQARITAVIVGTPVQKKLMELYRAGAVMSGTSAGAAIMSKVMITGNELINKDSSNIFVTIMKGNVEAIEGVGFLDNVIIDQHFVARKRLNRLISAVLEHPALPGVGIDESTSVIVAPDGSFEVLGNGTVVVVDGRAATGIHTDTHGNFGAQNLGLNVFTSGQRFSVQGGVTLLPPVRP